MKIAFHSYQLGDRGTEVALYNYAKYNKELLGNESVIISTSSRPTPTFSRFEKEFKTILYPDIWKNDGKNDVLRNKLMQIVDEEKIDRFYAIKGGENDGIMPTNCKTFAHCIFNLNEPHGDVYAGISKYLSMKHGSIHPYLYQIITKYEKDDANIRAELNIPNYALVLGRHGGYDQFSVDFIYAAIRTALERRPDLYFIFANTKPFIAHDRVIFLPWIKDKDLPKFIHSCDAMIHARKDGETSSSAIAEFVIRNKPIIAYKGGADLDHVWTLGDKGLFYTNSFEAVHIMTNLNKAMIQNNNWNVYGDQLEPKPIMTKFQELFLNN